MAKFLFMSNGYFVNMDLIIAMKTHGQIGSLQYIEIWFTGNSPRETASLSFRGKEANELFDELLKVHRMIGWTGEDEQTPPATAGSQ